MSNATAPPVTIVEFLTARLDEKQRAAEECAEVYPAPWELSDRGHTARVRADEPNFWVVAELEQHPSVTGWLGDRLEHIALHDPAHVLADIAAKRRIVARHDNCDDTSFGEPCNDLRDLASVDADHPDYDPAWKI